MDLATRQNAEQSIMLYRTQDQCRVAAIRPTTAPNARSKTTPGSPSMKYDKGTMERHNDKLASGPKFKVGDRVSVPVRFGETGTVKELKDGRYGVEFHNLSMTVWYDENELRPQTGKGLRWFRMPNTKG